MKKKVNSEHVQPLIHGLIIQQIDTFSWKIKAVSSNLRTYIGIESKTCLSLFVFIVMCPNLRKPTYFWMKGKQLFEGTYLKSAARNWLSSYFYSISFVKAQSIFCIDGNPLISLYFTHLKHGTLLPISYCLIFTSLGSVDSLNLNVILSVWVLYHLPLLWKWSLLVTLNYWSLHLCTKILHSRVHMNMPWISLVAVSAFSMFWILGSVMGYI